MDVYNKYLPMQQQPDRVLAQKELYEINNMLISHGHKPLPVGTRSKAAARKLNKMNLGTRHSLEELHQLNRADQKEIIRGLAKDYKMKGVREAAEEIKERRSKKAELLNNVAAKRIQKNYRFSTVGGTIYGSRYWIIREGIHDGV
jgi:hypothetical protein